MGGIEIPTEVQGILDWWFGRIEKVLKPKLKSAILFGSLTLGDFMPGWSDVDICVVLTMPITEKEGAAVGSIHDEMEALFLGQRKRDWRSGQVIEGPYIPLEMARDPMVTMPCFIAEGRLRKWANWNPIRPFSRYMLSQSAIPFFGERVLFTPPTREQLVAELQEDINDIIQADEGALRSPIWMGGMLQSVARAMVFWRDGKLLSKTAALEHEIASGSPFSEAFRLALWLRQTGSAEAQKHVGELRKHLTSIGRKAADQLEGLAAQDRQPNWY